MTERHAKYKRYPIRDKEQTYGLVSLDGAPLGAGWVTKETIPLPVAIQKHHEEMVFDVVDMASHDIVLGVPWLKKHNPQINWKTETVTLGRDCVIRPRPLRQLNATKDERRSKTTLPGNCAIPNSKRGHSEKPPPSTVATDTDRRPTGQQVSNQAGINTPSDYPQEYQRWAALFEEGTDESALPKHESWDHEIPLVEGKTPGFGPIYALSETELKALKKYLAENIRKGFVRPSRSPAGYPILFVPKKDGKLRLCVDYRQLNKITIKNRYPLPNIGELQDRLTGAMWLTRLDLRGAYNLIRMKEGEEWKTAFRTRYGYFEYMVMPFGLTNAPATCQGLMNDTLAEYLDVFVVAYLDDILIYSKTLKEHKQHVEAVLDKLLARKLLLNPEKCEFHKHQVDFLGFRVGRQGIQMDPGKISEVLAWPEPRNVKEVQEFLGFGNFNRRFINGYSTIAIPLTNLTKKDVPFNWTTLQQHAFDKLKDQFATAPCLIWFTPGRPVRIETDASDKGIGACLLQQNPKGEKQTWHPVAYMSRKMTPAELNYDIHDKELLAIVAAFQDWRVYVEGASEITVFTDHKNLVNFCTTKQLNRRQVRWSELLSQHKFVIQYHPGKDNGRADALSRRSDVMEGQEDRSHSILKQNKDGSLSANHSMLAATMTVTIESEVEQRLKRACQKDKTAKDLLKESEGLQIPEIKGRLYVPRSLRHWMVQRHHDDTAQGHPGVSKTVELLSRNYYFPGMRKEAERYISKCQNCQLNKHRTHAPYGHIQYAKIADYPWQDITMDFIVKLPKSEDIASGAKYDSILVVVDKLTKYAHLIPCNESFNARQTAWIVLDRVIRHHGIPESVTSDRDKIFTSNFWQTLMNEMGTKLKLSTAYHPQTDGQTERTNQTLEQYLRHYVTYSQRNWVQLLPTAELALNNGTSSTTGETPFFANYGRHPNLFNAPRKSPQAEAALREVSGLKRMHEELSKSIEYQQRRNEPNANKKRKKEPQLKEGDKVYLLTKNLKTSRKCKKLDHKKVGPFRIERKISNVNYKLDLPKGTRIHPVFHVSLLEPAHPETPAQDKPPRLSSQDEYEVEKVIDYDKESQQYLVRWKGYDQDEDTWHDRKDLTDCIALVRKYDKSH